MNQLMAFLLASGGVTTALLGAIYRRFRRSVSRDLEPFGRYVSQGSKYYLGRFIRRQLAAEFSLRRYARDRLRTTGAEMHVPATFPKSLETDKVFVPLLLSGAAEGTIEYQELAGRPGSRTLVIGEPGSGKSSLMKRTFRDACRVAATAPRGAPVPLVYELRELAELPPEELVSLSADSLFHAVTGPLRNAAIFKSEEAPDVFKYGPGFFVLLDGLDEVPREAAPNVMRAITALTRKLAEESPRSSTIVSTRTQHFISLHDRSFIENFRVLQIRPFTVADIYQFLLRWRFAGSQRENVTRLFARIRQLPSLTEMCTNPLALAMYVARDEQTQGTSNPETRTEFYKALVDELLVKRRLRHEQGTAGRQRLRAQRQRVVGDVCLEHLLCPDEAANSIPENRFLDAISDVGLPGRSPAQTLEELAIDTGLFSTERRGETLRFMHLTLCEFLAAEELVHRGTDAWTEIAARLREDGGSSNDDIKWASRLAELVAFATGLAPRNLGDEILASLAASHEPYLLLKAAIEAQSYDTATVEQTILQEISRLSEIPPDRWDVTWYSDLRAIVAALRDAHAGARDDLAFSHTTKIPTPTSFLVRLIARHGAEAALLRVLSRQDAEQAISIAERVNTPAAYSVVAEAADDYSVLVAVLGRYAAGVSAWGQALIHNALRERHVAAALARTSAALISDDAHRRERGGWERSYPLVNSAYGRLLDDLLGRPQSWLADNLTVFSSLTSVKPPRSALRCLLRGLPASATGTATALITILLATMAISSDKEGGGFESPDLAILGIPIVILALLLPVVPILLAMLRLLLRDSKLLVIDLPSPQIDGEAMDTDGVELVDHAGIRLARFSWLFQYSRGPVVEEMLNVEQVRLGAQSTADVWRPQRIQLWRSGARRSDVEALSAIRRARHSAR